MGLFQLRKAGPRNTERATKWAEHVAHQKKIERENLRRRLVRREAYLERNRIDAS
jgi:hypothetical protein